MLAGISKYIPLWADLSKRSPSELGGDVVAGTVTAILIIPQAIAYALLAGLPPLMGLSAAIVAPLVYAFLGTSRAVIIGPAAVQAVMVAAALVPLGSDPQVAVEGALILGAMSGGLLIVLGAFRFGWLTNFISNPVLTGFTTGAVIYIMITQLAGLVGIKVSSGTNAGQAAIELLRHAGSVHGVTAACGIGAVMMLLASRYVGPRLAERVGMSPSGGHLLGRVMPLAIVAGFTGLSASLALGGAYGVAVVGSIPSELPHLKLALKLDGWQQLVPGATLIALVGYIETLSVAKALAFRRRERIDPDRELVSLGVTNVATAAFGGMPVAGSFSKSAVNFEAGAGTQLAGIIAAAWVALCTAFFTGFLYELPRSVRTAN